MVWPLIGSIIGAGASLIGGAMNNSATAAANDKNIAAVNKANAQNLAAQKEFAKSGVRWRVADAEAAGVHPLYALGAQGASFSPSFQAGQVQPETGMGDALASGGQSIGNAVAQTVPENIQRHNEAMMTLQLERGSLENELLRSQIRRELMGSRPAFPVAAGSELPVGKDLKLMGDRFKVSKETSPASKYQDQYGDIVENLVGVPMAVGDLWKHLTKDMYPWLESNPTRRKNVEVTEERTRNISPFPYDPYYNSPSAR